jgi:hypothetical protein
LEVPLPIDLSETARTVKDGKEVGEKAIEETQKHIERRQEVIRGICEQMPDLPICTDPKKPEPPKKKSKSDDPDSPDQPAGSG